jgi:hypothetical protein
MCVEVCDGPGEAAEKMTIDMIQEIPDEPNPSLHMGNTAADVRWYFPLDLKEPKDIVRYMNEYIQYDMHLW